MFIQLKNHKVHIFSKMEIDTSKKSILFIPGAGMDHRILSMFKMDSFVDEYNIIAIDLPGHGYTTGPLFYDVESHTKLCIEVLNELNLKNLMCKKTISVNWLGEIYDCDFNQQINFREDKGPKTLFDLLDESFTFDYGVAVKEHCFACTAGAGSSCGGTLS